MKKILEVLRYGENDIRFRTDLDPTKDPDIINQTVTEVALAISDLGVSVNRREMVGFLDSASAALEDSLREARRAFEQKGGKVMVFGPGVAPPKSRS